VDSDNTREATSPKHGKVDNEEHHGGNTWAGGTGGADTAGLGGRGGPYRLDKGNNVWQVSDEEKAKVPQHVLDAARAMGQEAYARRLEEINMSQYEAEAYEAMRTPAVVKAVSKLRTVLQATSARQEERTWLRHQQHGELDDGKLVDGVAGDRAVFKRRGKRDTPPAGTPGSAQTHPKRLTCVVDCSGSMYRFNGHDRRLQRMQETVLLLMESLAGFEVMRRALCLSVSSASLFAFN
jgi:hypothetical protein